LLARYDWRKEKSKKKKEKKGEGKKGQEKKKGKNKNKKTEKIFEKIGGKEKKRTLERWGKFSFRFGEAKRKRGGNEERKVCMYGKEGYLKNVLELWKAVNELMTWICCYYEVALSSSFMLGNVGFINCCS
jgi:hypothetical protein